MGTSEEQRRTLWVDVSTLVGWRGNTTGIARSVGQLVRHWLADGRLPVRLCRYDPIWQGYLPVDSARFVPAEVRPAEESDERTIAPGSGRPSTSPPPSSVRSVYSHRWSSLFWHRLPENVRDALWHFYHGAKCAGRVVRAFWRRLLSSGRKVLHLLTSKRPGPLFMAGDVLFIAGAAWKDGPPAEVLARLRETRSIRVVYLLHDITPLRAPHMCAPDLAKAFTRWVPGVLSNSDLVLLISSHARRDLETYCREQGVAIPQVERVRWGDEPGNDDSESPPVDLLARYPGPFVLFVSSISLHKNQTLLFQVWRRLIERHGGGVPTLVLVGGPGWRVEQIVADLYSDPVLSRHVAYLPKVNDQQLRWLYRRCLFTVFPSHYEGWGLPVAESLMYGKYCICSSATSLPEVGGELVDYHDPLDGLTCQRLIEQALFEPGRLAAREERIRREYTVTRWQECARQTFALLDRHMTLREPPAEREAA